MQRCIEQCRATPDRSAGYHSFLIFTLWPRIPYRYRYALIKSVQNKSLRLSFYATDSSTSIYSHNHNSILLIASWGNDPINDPLPPLEQYHSLDLPFIHRIYNKLVNLLICSVDISYKLSVRSAVHLRTRALFTPETYFMPNLTALIV